MAANKRKGILFILTSAFFFSLMTVFVRLSGDVPTMQKAFFRNIVAAILAAILLVRSKEGFSFQKKNLPDLFLRSSIGTAGILCNFWAVDHMNIADANILNKLSPFFAILMSIFILKEKPNRVEWLSTGTCGRARACDRHVLLRILNNNPSAQPAAQLSPHDLAAVPLPGACGLLRRLRTAGSHSRLSERAGSRHFCI